MTKTETVRDNKYRDVEYFSFTNKFAVKICENPVRRMPESFDSLEDAIAARDVRLARLAAKDRQEMRTRID